MNDEDLFEEATVEPEVEVVDPDKEGPKEDGPRAQWQYKTQFGIVEEMQRAVQLTVAACQSELEVLRRKLNKLNYGGGR